ncbi:MAG: hypothetical protein ACE149_07395 [Armatimonadota bacterium]
MAKRLPWIVIAVVALATAALPELRNEARFQWKTLPRRVEPALQPATRVPKPDPILDWTSRYVTECAAYVREHRPNNPEMLMAAGSMAPDRAAGLELLKRATELKPDPVVLSAYVDGLLASGPYYQTPATLGADPGRRGQMRAAKAAIKKNKVPTQVSPSEAAPLLAAVARWERADPENAMPIAIEVWCLNGLGEREKAIARWREAARRPKVDGYAAERAVAARALLVDMGLPMPEAVVACQWIGDSPSAATLAASARMAYHEGRRAQLEGRAADALGCWQATVDIGAHAQACADLISDFAAGVNIQAVGGAPAWRWGPNARTGEEGQGLLRGSLFYGREHEFFRNQAGKSGDERLRDTMITAKARTGLTRQYTEMVSERQWYTRAGELLVFGQLAGGFLVLSAVLLALTTWVRRRRAEGPSLQSPWLFLTPLPGFIVLAVAAGITVALSMECATTPLRVARGQDEMRAVLLAAAAALGVAAIAMLFARRAGVTRGRAWVDGVHAGMSVAVVVSSLLYLGLGIGAMDLRRNWVAQNVHPRSEMERVRLATGRAWEKPPTPPGSWVPGYAPER